MGPTNPSLSSQQPPAVPPRTQQAATVPQQSNDRAKAAQYFDANTPTTLQVTVENLRKTLEGITPTDSLESKYKHCHFMTERMERAIANQTIVEATPLTEQERFMLTFLKGCVSVLMALSTKKYTPDLFVEDMEKLTMMNSSSRFCQIFLEQAQLEFKVHGIMGYVDHWSTDPTRALHDYWIDKLLTPFVSFDLVSLSDRHHPEPTEDHHRGP